MPISIDKSLKEHTLFLAKRQIFWAKLKFLFTTALAPTAVLLPISAFPKTTAPTPRITLLKKSAVKAVAVTRATQTTMHSILTKKSDFRFKTSPSVKSL